MAHGTPAARPDPRDAAGLLVGDERYLFSDEVTDILLGTALPRD
jgi:hypothetical protein